jgi:hypothetical protein
MNQSPEIHLPYEQSESKQSDFVSPTPVKRKHILAQLIMDYGFGNHKKSPMPNDDSYDFGVNANHESSFKVPES